MGFGDFSEVVEVVEERVFEVGDARFDVTRQGEIDEKERAGGTLAQGGGGGRDGDDRFGSGGGTDDDVKFGEARFTLFEGQGARAERGGEFHRALEISTGNGERSGAAALESLGGFFSDVARAEQQNARGFEVAENVLGEIDGDIGDADLADGDRRLRAYVFGGLKRFLENAVEDGAGGLASLGGRVGGFNLAENFGLAEHLRVEAGGDFEEMLDRVAADETQSKSGEFFRRETLPRAENSFEASEGLG